MKLLYYSPHPHLNLSSPSGYGTHMREMIKAFEKLGCEVTPVIMGGTGNPPEETLANPQPNVKQFFRRLLGDNFWRTLKDINLLRFDRAAARELENAVIEYQPDMIYERCNYLQLSGIEIAQKHSITHVMEVNSPYVEQVNSMSKSKSYIEKIARKREKRQLKDTDLALAMVTPLKEYFCREYGINPDKFLVTHDAFNQDNIRLNPETQEQIREKHNLTGKTVVGYIGSIFEWHGLDKIIRAFHELDPPDTKLLIVGYGEYMKVLIEQVESLGRQEDVIFTGRVPREVIFDYINIMDICVAPDAAWYQSPVKIFEYGAMGKPILGPDTRAVRELMEPEVDGLLVQPNVSDVKKALNRLLTNPSLGDQLGRSFQQKVLNEYTWVKNARAVLDYLNVSSI